MVSYDDLFQVCVKYTAADYFVGDVIPENKLVNARKSYPVPEQERIVALLDTTVFRSAKNGLAIGETGLHWRNSSVETSRTYLSWQELGSVPLKPKGIMPPRIEMGKGIAIELASGGLSKHDALKLFTDLQHLVRSPSANRPSSLAGAGEQWVLAVGSQQYGPYDLATIATMVKEGRVDPEECWAWKEGTPNWKRFAEVPALKSLLPGANRPPAMPPPLPTSAPTVPQAPRPWEPPQGLGGPNALPRAVSYDDLLRVCAKYAGDGYYVGEAIPHKKLANARSSFSIPDSGQVVALFDITAFGGAKDGLAVCTEGIYWHNMFAAPERLLWAGFSSAEIGPKGGGSLKIGEGEVLQIGIAMKRDDALRLLSEIQAVVRTSNGAQKGTDGATTSPRLRQGARAAPSHGPPGHGTTAELPRPDLNQSPVDDLLALPAISLPNGQKLVRERERRGGFGTVEEAGHFLGLQPHQVERLKQRAMLGPYEGARPSGGRVVDF